MTVKRKLVRSYGSHSPAHQPLPREYENARLRWLGCVRVETDNGVVNEYEIQPDKKLFLNDFMKVVIGEIEKLEDAHYADWQVDIFKLTRRR